MEKFLGNGVSNITLFCCVKYYFILLCPVVIMLVHYHTL